MLGILLEWENCWEWRGVHVCRHTCVCVESVLAVGCVYQESAVMWKLLVSLAFKPLKSSLAVVWVGLGLLISKLSLFRLLRVDLLSQSTFLVLVGSCSL